MFGRSRLIFPKSQRFVVNESVVSQIRELESIVLSGFCKIDLISIEAVDRNITHIVSSAISLHWKGVETLTFTPDSVRFHKLASDWRKEVSTTSSPVEMARNKYYQSIVGMGEVAVPFILRDLDLNRSDPDHWFIALKLITGVDPVKEEDRGDTVRMAETWVNWGRQNKYAW